MNERVTTPTTAAGRDALHIYAADERGLHRAILAIEAEARAAALDAVGLRVEAAFRTEDENPSESAEDLILAAIDALRRTEG